MSANEIILKNVSKAFGGNVVVDNLSLVVEPGRFTALIGPSGCGKTTIVGLIAGYDHPSGGLITINSIPVTAPGRDRLVVFQESALFPWKSTLDNVIFGPLSRGVRRADAIRQATKLLERFGLSGFEHRLPEQLSGGMQRRAELARAMINSPDIMLLDEPFRGLDALTRELMQEYLLKLFDEAPITTLFVTSEIEESIYLADRVVVLSKVPTSVKRIVAVDLPRPRDIKMLTTARFADIYREILSSLFSDESEVISLPAR